MLFFSRDDTIAYIPIEPHQLMVDGQCSALLSGLNLFLERDELLAVFLGYGFDR